MERKLFTTDMKFTFKSAWCEEDVDVYYIRKVNHASVIVEHEWWDLYGDRQSERLVYPIRNGEIKIGKRCLNPYYCDGEYVPSSTNGDYSPSCPWNAPGMQMRDFI